MPNDRFVERRRYVRFDATAKIMFHIKGDSGGSSPTELSAITKNINVEGICFITEQEVKPGSIVAIEAFFPPYGAPLHIEGVVVWCRLRKHPSGRDMFEVGVKLSAIDKDDEAKFIGYVCERMMERYEDDSQQK